ncbi:MGMT family protein [Pseudofulvimonas gallinarii]|jgi:methylated-DNA-protein-cysteine methyltransferase-like protein|uniref:Methylated-DNA-protein-cysteine methyltransferase-like protein n=1 Tax=Pseudofulvimonas gallinarii TaxID=634155 RepID=A0A4R3LL64_9GAMM|nr:MGMT family protein [Pseudofulvimonas gallinarii]TCT00661.1 methylated-DNA-protein-cysteine methyltransferase-like protein [Pseudofulvimonas gallinarii]THD12022.1 cysteine methyltransferase [Pseudofulvimonas gallinarii]
MGDDSSRSAVPATFPRIWAVIAAIPAGTVLSYGEVARRAGLPRRARLVAQALRAVPDAMPLPWHRVLRSDGRIAFPADSLGFREQCNRLRSEGVEVSATGRVRLAAAAMSLDELLWRP